MSPSWLKIALAHFLKKRLKGQVSTADITRRLYGVET